MMFDFVRADLERKRNHYFLVDTFFEKFIKTSMQLGTIAVVYYRFGNWAWSCQNRIVRMFAISVYDLLGVFEVAITGILINPRLKIGKGLIIHNFSGVIVDAESIGDNLTINQCVTIGPSWRENGKPKIGNNVFIGSGAKVLGGVHVGDNVVVAANAFVMESVPDNCTVVGVPARIISRQATSNYLNLGASTEKEFQPKPATQATSKLEFSCLQP